MAGGIVRATLNCRDVHGRPSSNAIPLLISKPKPGHLWSIGGLRPHLLVFLLVACSGSQEPAEQGVLPDRAVRIRTASPVRQVMVSSPEASFTIVPRLAVDSRGRIYVPDTYRQRVSVLTPEGRLLRTIGRRGDGPDEFRAVQSVQILPGDSRGCR
jgi:hypothetical protein